MNDFPVLSETFILNQLIGLLRRNHDVQIEASSSGSSESRAHSDVARWQLVEKTYYRSNPSLVLDSLNPFLHGRRALNLTVLHDRFPPKCEPRRFDIIHCHFGPNGQRALALRKLGALVGPILTTFHGYDLNLLPKLYGPDMYRELLNGGDLFSVGSEFMRKKLLALGAEPNRIVKLAMGVDLSRYIFKARREALNEIVLLSVGRLVEVKGIEYALRAVALIRETVPRLRYRIVGDGLLRPALEALASHLAINDIVEFKGAMSQDKMLDEYAAAHIFVHPSIVTEQGEEEGQGLVLAEAQASGIPIVATNVGGVPESLMAGVSGIVVPARNASALGVAIISLAKDESMREQMGQQGRHFVEAHFNLEKQNDALVDLYGDLIRFSTNRPTEQMADNWR